jgi:predicted PurR-regulated permease PerM
MHQVPEVKLVIPAKTIVTILSTAFAVWILYHVRDILTLFLIVVAIVVTFSPIIRSWEKYIPRSLAIMLLYTLIALSAIIITALILPLFFSQLRDFLFYLQSVVSAYGVTNDSMFEQLRNNLSIVLQNKGTEIIGPLLTQFRGSLGTLYSTTMGVVGGIVAIFTVFISSFYLLQEEKNFQEFLANLVPASHRKRVNSVMDRIVTKMGNYLRGQVLLMVIVGTVIAIALTILGVPYSLLLGLWAGVMEILPYVGPIFGALPGVFLAFSTLGVTGGLIAILIYFLVQQLENQFLVPKIMGRALGLSPVVIIFSLLIGGKLLGFVGLLIAVPITAAIGVIYEEWRSSNLNEA